MNEQTKLLLALMQIENIISLIQGNEYQQYLNSQLVPVQIELKRQLTNAQHSAKLNS